MKRPLLLAFVAFLVPLEAETLRIVEVRDLVGNEAGEALESDSRLNFSGLPVFPAIRIPGNAEVYLGRHEAAAGRDDRAPGRGALVAALRLPDDQPVEGICYLGAKGDSKHDSHPFTYDPGKSDPATREAFDAVRKAHYARLARSDYPGSAWFRHRAGGLTVEGPGRAPDAGLDATFRLVTGSRAAAENLALDRDLILGGVEGTPVELDSVKGVTVRPLDWTGKLKPGEVKVDPLAALIPHDQHALFAPSLGDLFELIDVIESEGTPILQSFDARNPYRELPSRYKAQMGLDVPSLIASRLPVTSVAVTGGDPFFPSGTDLAVVLASATPDLLLEAIEATIGMKAKARGATTPADAAYRGYQSPDRSFSAWFTKVDGAVVVANSPVALKRIEAVAKGETPSLASLDEFKYFRQRYPLGAEETAYLFLSDATIRRWASPRVRIAASRRTRAAAALGELTARMIDAGEGEMFTELLGRSEAAGDSVRSAVFNTLGFLTPVSELDFTTVTPSEAAAYERWRDGYENGWRLAFDPIAIRLKLGKMRRDIDFTLMPLRVDSDYREWIEVTGTAPPEKGAVTAHPGSLAFLSFAVDPESKAFRELGEWSLEMIPALKARPLAWVGDSVSLYFDDGFFWKALETGDAGELVTSNFLRIPVGVRIASRSSVRLAVFLAATRGFIDQSAPDLLKWEKRKHGEQSYLAVLSREEDDPAMQGGVFYAALKGALLLSLDEKVLQRAIDREAGTTTSGRHVAAEVSPGFLQGVGGMLGATLLERQRRESWEAIPILNEWRRLAPDQDPVAFHAGHFRESIHCPGGKGYRWNEDALTMESVAFGHPADPRGDEVALALVKNFSRIKVGLDFVDDGLRLHVEMNGSAPGKPADPAEAKPEIPPGFPQAQDLIPAKAGVVRTYRVTETWADAPYTKEVSIRALEAKGDGTLIRTRVVTHPPGDEEPTVHEEQHLLGGGYRWVASRDDESSHVFSIPMPILPGELAPGVEFGGEHRSERKDEDGVAREIGDVRGKVVGLETVTVPAGVFENCVRIDGEYDYLNYGTIGRVRDSSWFAPGVGLVKTTWEDDFNSGTEVLEKFEPAAEP